MQSDILVTGATGFIGSAVIDCMLAASRDVRATDIAQQPPRAIPSYTAANLLDSAAAAAVARDVHTVVHAAGLAHRKRLSNEVVKAYFDVNVGATKNIAQAAVSAGVKHFILISSVSVYGKHGTSLCDETTPCHPLGPYAESKYQAEQAVLQCAENSKMRVTILRLATAFGEGDPGNVAKLLRLIDSGRFVWIGRGDNLKTLIYRDDVAAACNTVVDGKCDAKHQIFNVAMAPCSMRDIVTILAEELNRRLPTWHIPSSLALRGTAALARLAGNRGRLGALRASVEKWIDDDAFDGRKLQRVLGFQPTISLHEGMRREVAWYRKSVNSGKSS